MPTKTISTHNGSAAHRAHNIRKENATEKQRHIDPRLSHYNEILIDEAPREAYRRIFGEALEDYNQSQRDKGRPERCISDYYSHIEADKNKHAVYEMIIQVGDNKDTGIDCRATSAERKILKEFIAGWKERNPNLELIGAYIHADETDGTLHAHLDYVPVASGYVRGMAIQNGLVRALGEQGFETAKKGSETAQIRWQRRENAELERICNAYGITVKHPARETGQKTAHLDTENYKRAKESESLSENVQGAYTANQRLLQDNAELEQKKKGLEWDCRVAKAELHETKKETRWTQVKKVNHSLMDSIFPEKIDEDKLKRLEGRSRELKKAKATISDLEAKLKKSEARAAEADAIAYSVHQREKTVAEREKRASQTLSEALEGKTHNTNKRLTALERFCEEVKFKDGRSVLEAFDDREERKRRERAYEDRGMSL